MQIGATLALSRHNTAFLWGEAGEMTAKVAALRHERHYRAIGYVSEEGRAGEFFTL
jgi:hypothetical protein